MGCWVQLGEYAAYVCDDVLQAAMLASKIPYNGKEDAIAKQDGSKVTLQLAKIRKGPSNYCRC